MLDQFTDEAVVHPSFPDYRLRIVQPRLCDTVTQYSGYIDVSEHHHLFFWYVNEFWLDTPCDSCQS